MYIYLPVWYRWLNICQRWHVEPGCLSQDLNGWFCVFQQEAESLNCFIPSSQRVSEWWKHSQATYPDRASVGAASSDVNKCQTCHTNDSPVHDECVQASLTLHFGLPRTNNQSEGERTECVCKWKVVVIKLQQVCVATYKTSTRWNFEIVYFLNKRLFFSHISQSQVKF